MERMHFDTYEEVKHLTATGFSEEQSVSLVRTILSLIRFNVATKEDLAYVRDELKGDIATVHKELAANNERMARIEGRIDTLGVRVDGIVHQLTRWIIPLLLIILSALIGVAGLVAKSAL